MTALVPHGATLFAAACAGSGLACLATGRAGASRAWSVIGVMLLAAGLTAGLALDQQSVIAARALAQRQGWYAARRELQSMVLTVLLLGGLWATAASVVPLSRAGAALRWAAAGAGLIVAVMALRLVSWHATDALVQAHVAGVSAGRWAEGLGLGLVAFGLFRARSHAADGG